MKKNVAPKYWREVVSKTIYTLNKVQVKKGSNLTPFDLWYGHATNVKYFIVFARKCYMLKDNRNGKLDGKSDEGILLGYPTKIKAYKCLNYNTNKVVETANVKVDEHVEKNEVKYKKEPNDYRSFIYIDEGELITLPKTKKKALKKQKLVHVEL